MTQLVDPFKPVNEEPGLLSLVWVQDVGSGERRHPDVTQPAAACCASSRFSVVTESGCKNPTKRWFCRCLNLFSTTEDTLVDSEVMLC